MLLLLSEDTGMDGGSGNVEYEGKNIDGIEDSKEGMVIVGGECKDGTRIGDTECDDTGVGTGRRL